MTGRWRGDELRDYAIHHALRRLPIDACSALGARLGVSLGRAAHPEADAALRRLLATLRPDLTDAEAASRTAWRNIGRTFAEVSVMDRILRAGRGRIAPTAVADALGPARPPLIVSFVHLGNWEVLGHLLARQIIAAGYERFSCVVMPPKNRAHRRIAAESRQVPGVELLEMGPAIWRIVAERLAHGRCAVWLAADEAAEGQAMAPAFGRPLRTDGNLGKIIRLAAAAGATILPAWCERLDGAHFQAHTLPPLALPKARLPREAVAAHVATLDALFAPIVRQHLTQWYMASEFTPHTAAQLAP